MSKNAAPAAEDVHLLHNRGWVALHNGLPAWDVLQFAAEHHACWNDRVITELEALRPRWDEGDESSLHGGDRPGTVAAELATKRLQAQGAPGLFITAVHPCVSDAPPWQNTGPRFYVSIIPVAMAAMRDAAAGGTGAAAAGASSCRIGTADGCAVRPPAGLSALLWPAASDGAAPWITELGWTLVAPASDPQQMHADIVSEFDDEFARKDGVGRFHHIAWKPCGKRAATTHVADGAFTDGVIRDEHYDQLRAVHAREDRDGRPRDPQAATMAAAAIVIDSEVLHCGARTPPRADGTWSSTCTAQICSTSGWPALWSGGRVGEDLMKLTIPIAPVAVEQEEEEGGYSSPATPPTAPPTTGTMSAAVQGTDEPAVSAAVLLAATQLGTPDGLEAMMARLGVS